MVLCCVVEDEREEVVDIYSVQIGESQTRKNVPASDFSNYSGMGLNSTVAPTPTST